MCREQAGIVLAVFLVTACCRATNDWYHVCNDAGCGCALDVAVRASRSSDWRSMLKI